MATVVGELNHLQLQLIDPGWAENIYDAEFLDVVALPPEYEEALERVDLQETFENTIKSIDHWQSPEVEADEEKSWTTLSQLIPHKRLIALLAYYIDFGCKNVEHSEYRNYALLASRIYFKLLSIPGHRAYHIYHSQLFANCLACLTIPKEMCDGGNSFNARELTRQVNSVLVDLRNFVIDLRAIIENIHLTPNNVHFEEVLQNLVEITGGAVASRLHVDKIELANISGVVYAIIDILMHCNGSEQPNAEAIRLLFKCLLATFLDSSTDNRLSVVQASYVTYSGLLLNKYGKFALSSYLILLQHLCYNLEYMERAEARASRVSLVTGLMSLLPSKSYQKIVQWLIHLSASAKMTHRHLAMEMLSYLIQHAPDDPNAAEPSNNNASAGSSADFEPQPGPSWMPDEVPSPSAPSPCAELELSRPYTITTDDESSQDSQGAPNAEDEMVDLLRHRRHTVPHGAILRAMYDRADDVSGTIRTRALAILTECIENNNPHMIKAVTELHGTGKASTLLAVGARGLCDERAAVRRAAVGLVQRLLAHSSAPLPTHTDIALLAKLCRDASIIVRTAAISAMNELVTVRRSDVVIDVFLKSVMPQLSDPEVKIQQQTALYFQHLIIEPMKKFGAAGHNDPLPWALLDGVTRNNLKRYLQKACTLIKNNSGAINHRLVDILSSHIGVVDDQRDLASLVLLYCVAPYVEYSNVAFILDYYYKLADTEQGRDARLMALTLDVITIWSAYLQPLERSTLRNHLVRRLANARDDGCRIQCASLATELDPKNLTWATELMQLSESRAVSERNLEEAVRAADLSLMAPTPPQPALLNMFLSMLKEPPADFDEKKMGVAVAGAGRLCLRSRAAAELAAPAFAALLPKEDASLCARINAVHALADICIRYTCIVEPLLGEVCSCLAPETPALLRGTATRTITRLLLGGFLRLRTPLYYKYCALIVDPDHDVREPAEYYVTSCLTSDTIYHHFVDCVVHYNNDESEHKIEYDARQLIYDVMLQRMSLVQKLNIQCRLARDIIDHAADMNDEGFEELPPGMDSALLDTITMLIGPRMKLPKKPTPNAEGADVDELHERVKSNILSHKMKRTVAEVLVPAVLKLYSRIKTRGGQIILYLVRLTHELLNDYQQEIEEAFANDDELLARVRDFQDNVVLEAPTAGNVRNLVTSSAPPDPDTPHANRRRPRPALAHTPRKRALKI